MTTAAYFPVHRPSGITSQAPTRDDTPVEVQPVPWL